MKKILCTALILFNGFFALFGEKMNMKIQIDLNDAVTLENQKWRGMGMVSGNNSSRLLVDYRWEHPQKYQEILEYMFTDKGLGINHLKIEMGSDINSSSGTEPATMRFEDEKADVTRGAGFILASDAKRVNPDLTLDMLWWSEPLWVSSSQDVYAARYKWYKGNLVSAYEKFGLVFDYVSCTQNERATDLNWIKYLSKSLKDDKETPYDFSKIKIVAGEEVCTWRICDSMLKDKELCDAIDVVGSHYTSWSTPNTKYLQQNCGKEVWFSEGSSPMKYAKGTYRFDEGNSGLTGINGVLDIATRIITMYAQGSMTLYEFQPVINSYYDGVTYCCKQLITANEPWNGNYILDTGYYMTRHFSNFIPKGWCMINSGCNGDGKAGGDGHAIVDSKYNYLTACDVQTGDFSCVICNTTSEKIKYSFETKNLKNGNIYVWETRGPDSVQNPYDENYFKKIKTLNSKNGKFSFEVNPYSIVTLTTLDKDDEKVKQNVEGEILKLPYTDDFEYSEYDQNYLAERGNAPRYTTDEGGAFEVVKLNGKNVLKQLITKETKAKEWGATPEPVTNLGDDRWFNYSASIDVKFTENPGLKTYAGIGIRYNLPDQGKNGWWLQLYADGNVYLNQGYKRLAAVKTEIQEWNNLKISAWEDVIQICVNGKVLIQNTARELYSSLPSGGRVAIYSSYDQNYFDNLKVEEIDGYAPYITRYDDSDFCFNYSDGWNHSLMDSFKNHNRTISTGKGDDNCSFTLDFEGKGFNVTGVSKGGTLLEIEIDGKVIDTARKVYGTGNREILFFVIGLENAKHQAKVKIIAGEIKVDTAEVF